MLYWHVGYRIRADVLKNGRAEYGEQIVSTLSAQLVADYGQGFGLRSLRRMVQFAEVFPDEQIVASLSQQLTWSHFVEILPLKQPLEREFYAEMCRVERWSVRTLRERIAGQLYLRTAIAKQPEEVVKAEIGHLRSGGQMELYLRWLDKHDRAAGESEPIGLILCASADSEQVELLDMGASNIRVAEYLAHMPDRKLLQAQLHRAVLLARERAARTGQDTLPKPEE